MKIDTGWIDGWLKDLRYTASSLAARPGFTAMALLALVVGIALNVGVFTAINSLLTRPWNVPEPERVVNAYAFNPKAGPGYWGFPLAGVRYLNDNSRTIDGAFAARADRVRGANGIEAGTTAAYVTGNFFDVLGVRVEAGRAFQPGEDNPAAPTAVAVISHRLWMGRYAGDSGVVGETLTVDGIAFTIIGVAAKGFDGTTEDRTDAWLPFAAVQLVRPTDPALFDDPMRCCSELAARLRPGVSREEATAEWNTLYGEYLRELAVEPVEIVLTSPADPFAYAGALLVMLVAGVAACIVPARRAARTEPNTVLHHE